MRQKPPAPFTRAQPLSIDSLPAPLAVLDVRGRIRGANAALVALLAPAPVRGDLRKRLAAAAGDIARDGFGEAYAFGEGAARRWLRLNVEPGADGDLAVLTDITAIRAALDQARPAREALDRLMSDAVIGTWRFDPDADVYFFSVELLTPFEARPAPVPRAAVEALVHRDDLVTEAQVRERITREGGEGELALRMRGADGDWRHMRILLRAGRRLTSGRFEMYGLTQQVTELARARDEANAVAQRLNLALKASRAGVFEYDYKKQVFWLSAEFSALVGPDGLARTRTDPFAFFHTADRAAILDLRERAAAGSGAEPADVRVIRPEGPLWVRLYLEVESGPDGRPLRGVGLMIDIDEAKRQELAVTEARLLAEAATAAKSDFLASVSHEIRTPMNGIVGVLNLLSRERLSAEGRSLLGEALGCTEMLSQLINDVLDFSKIEAGRLTLAPEPCDAAAIAASVVRLIKPQADVKGLALTTHVSDSVGWALIDPVRLRQCLFNIIGNAVKFTERGSVEVRLSMSGAAQRRKLRCEVEDTGIGLPESARERLFDRFQQIETGPARRFGGTGLGLAISRQLARLMGGDLDYMSVEGEGSTFWFEVAAPPTAAVEPDAERAIEGRPLAGLSVLVVDDNRVNRIVGVKTLEALGADAQAADSGVAAVEAVERTAFDLILMDVNMPGMDGLEATRRIRALNTAGARAPILALTADVMRHQHQAYLAAGMDGMVPKPFSPARLLAEIVRLAGGDAKTEVRSA